jgi:hypothetical protein
MIGFKLTATSNTIFTRNYESWTEGDIWLAKAFEITRGLTSPKEMVLGQAVSTVVPSPADAATAAFKGFLNGYLVKLAGIFNPIGVCIEGADSTFFSYTILNYEKTGMDTVMEFLSNLKRTSDVYNQELGDQVMIQICATIIAFDKHLGASRTFGHLWIGLEF